MWWHHGALVLFNVAQNVSMEVDKKIDVMFSVRDPSMIDNWL